MAYDAADPADRKILADAVAKALAEAEAEHEASTEGLRKKNKELLDKIKKGESDPEDLRAAEAELEKVNVALKQATKDLKAATKLAEDRGTELATEQTYSKDLLLDSNLTSELAAAKVVPQFLPAVKALLKPLLQIKIEGTERKILFGDKPLGEGIKEWSQGDQGKAFVSATINGGAGVNNGGNGPRGNEPSNAKQMLRSEYDALNVTNPAVAAKHFAEGGVLVDG